ncbi:hypothetical protein M404DRAFT_1008904 [Pisolithus tinctorius Marx 270]|uniref:Uncharacterized protein n=1 Tax=Pisolithus tinctorius Marx 270 TaxID=870435 RepID=A0A0C3I8N8_PISTI|nr:hypothetical protein M404DRAFT_1008904 [Pisolithus tinctorius Marx 270]
MAYSPSKQDSNIQGVLGRNYEILSLQGLPWAAYVPRLTDITLQRRSRMMMWIPEMKPTTMSFV